MKIKTVILSLLLVSAAILSAQTVHEPNSQIYKDIDYWTVQGYIRDFLPLVRPYPAPLIEKILKEVRSNGNAAAREKAEYYLELLSPESRFFHLGILGNVEGNENDLSIIGAPFVEGLFRLNNLLSASYFFGVYGMTDEQGERFNIPGTYTPYSDFIPDDSSVGRITIRMLWTSLVAIGTSDIYFQAGLSRSSFGPFFDNGIVVGPQAPRAGHFSFVYHQPQWSFEMLFQMLSASDDFGKGRFTDKYNVIHNVSFRPMENLEFGIVQSMVWGKRMEVLYLVPFTFLFASQSLTGFLDNSFIGIHFRWRPLNSLLINGQVYVDDFNFNGIFKGAFEAKAAGEIGVSWTPRSGFLSKLDFDYTMVLPYTYNHWTEPLSDRYNGAQSPLLSPFNYFLAHDIPVWQNPNHLNYSHLGRNIGPDLEPNSDRVSIRTNWHINKSIDLNLSAYFTRHGNATDGMPGIDPDFHDGSIFDDGFDDPWISGKYKAERLPYGFNYFLTQNILDIRLGGSLGVTWTIPSSFGVFKLSAGYGIQYGWNRDLKKGNDGLAHFWSIGGQWKW
jgi:hypothetical protein